MSGVSAAIVSSPSRERQAQRRVALRQLADPAGDLEQLHPRQPDVVVERLRDQLAPARELPLDQARARATRLRRGRSPGFAASRSRPRRRPRRRSTRASSRSARAGTFASSGSATVAALELGVLDRQPVGVGRDHRQRRPLGLDQHPGEDRPDLVARGGARHQLDRLGQRGRRSFADLALRLRQAREVLGREGAQVEAGRCRRSARRRAARCAAQGELAVGEAADDVDAAAGPGAGRCRPARS